MRQPGLQEDSRNLGKIVRGALCVLCAAFLIGGAALLAASAYFKSRAIPNAVPGLNVSDAEFICDEQGFPAVDWDYWKAVNPDIAGWVTVPGTSIDLPIVQARADESDFYLTHDIYREWNFMGCPYLDAECEKTGLDSICALVYGHNSDDGSMFADFAKYSDPEYADEHRRILLQTPDAKRALQVASVSVVKGNDAGNGLQLDPAVAFCTCSYNFWPDDERTIVYAIDSETK